MLKPQNRSNAAPAAPRAAALPQGRRTIKQMIAAGAVSAALALSLTAAPIQAHADEQDGQQAAPSISMTLAKAVETVASPQSFDKIHAYSTSLIEAAQKQEREKRADALLTEARKHEGAPYVYGGTTPAGFDCSGFTSYVYRTALGIELPRTAAAQAGMGESVSMDALEPGDLLYWGSGSGVYHVGIYVGDGSYIHAAGSGKGVRVQTMEWFHPDFAKRVL